jgi:hypothetical protein
MDRPLRRSLEGRHLNYTPQILAGTTVGRALLGPAGLGYHYHGRRGREQRDND